MIAFELPNEEATRSAGALLAGLAPAGLVVLLRGDLGAGKSTFARSVIKAFGWQGEVPSPTFVVANTYDTSLGLVVHADLYRVQSVQELQEIGLEELIDQAVLTLVEWPERLLPQVGDDHLMVSIEGQGDTRDMHMTGTGPLAGLVMRAWHHAKH